MKTHTQNTSITNHIYLNLRNRRNLWFQLFASIRVHSWLKLSAPSAPSLAKKTVKISVQKPSLLRLISLKILVRPPFAENLPMSLFVKNMQKSSKIEIQKLSKTCQKWSISCQK